ncbi:FtsX-like permease family protein [Kitasatospora sp. NPDC008050]|uniref:FtsX-like permease family protein n=1 Tax=Kitasatospora sp. NPDC008050 TaxID=3364021 RepID=UPI0036E7D662
MGGFILRRLRSRLALAAAAVLTIVLTATVLCTLNAFESGVGDAGVRRAMAVQDRARATVQVTDDVASSGRAPVDQQVRGLASRIFGPLPAQVREIARSHAYGLPATGATGANGQPVDPDLTLLASLDPAEVTLSAGRLPQAAAPGGPVQVAVPDTVTHRLGLRPEALPTALHLVDRYDGSALDVLITGTYHPTDTADPYWQLDPLGGHGVTVNGFTTYGPLLVQDSVFTGGTVTQQSLALLLTGDFSHARATELDALRDRTAQQIAAFRTGTGMTATSSLTGALDDLHNDLLVARSTLVIGALQLAVLAIAALVLVTRLLGERQAAENALLTARGATWRRIAGLTALEAGLLALPAVLLAPLLTPALLTLLGRYGPLAHAKVRLSGGLTPVSWLLALAVAVGAVLVVLVPAVTRVLGTSVLQRRAGRRQALVSALGRSGTDLALLVLAALAYFQLAHYGSGPGSSVSATAAGSAAAGGGALSADASGRLGLDPVLVTAPTLALCAGTVLALRLLPLVARLGERWAGRRRGLPGALAGWQFARRPRRNAGPVLLMVFAISMGMLALGQAASLSASQRDQSAFASLGGLRVTNLAVPALGQGGVLDQLPAGSRFLPVSRQELPLQAGRIGQLLAIDAKAAAASVRMRPDLSGGRTPAQFFAPLTGTGTDSGGADVGGIVLPGKPIRLNLDLSVRSAVSATPAEPPGEFTPDPGLGPPTPAPAVRLELRDRHGIPFEALTVGVPADGDTSVSADLAPLIGSPAGRAAYPLTLTGVRLTYDGPVFGDLQQQLTVHRMTTTDLDGGSTTAIGSAARSWTVRSGATLAPANGQDLFGVTYTAGQRELNKDTWLAVGGSGGAPPTVLDALATKDYLTATGAAVGQVIPLSLGSASLQARIVAVVPALPGAGGQSGGPTTALMVDLPTVDQMLSANASLTLPPTEWWLPGTGPTDPAPAQAAAALRAGTVPAQLQVYQELVSGLRDDPLGAAPQSALLALTVAAAVLAAIGFAAAAVGAAGERAAEFAVLRALGTAHRQLARTAAAEQGILIALGLGVGAALGTALTHLVVPLTVLSADAHRPTPAVLVVLPFGQVLVLLAAVAALPVLLTVHRVLRPARASETIARLRHSEEM